MSRYAVRRVSLGATLKFGLVLGTLLSLLPGCLCGLLSLWLLGGLRGFLEGWKQGGIVILGQKIPMLSQGMSFYEKPISGKRSKWGDEWQ